MTATRRKSLPWAEFVLFFAVTITLIGYVLTILFFGPWGHEIPHYIPDALHLDFFATAATKQGL